MNPHRWSSSRTGTWQECSLLPTPVLCEHIYTHILLHHSHTAKDVHTHVRRRIQRLLRIRWILRNNVAPLHKTIPIPRIQRPNPIQRSVSSLLRHTHFQESDPKSQTSLSSHVLRTTYFSTFRRNPLRIRTTSWYWCWCDNENCMENWVKDSGSLIRMRGFFLLPELDIVRDICLLD